MLLFEKESSIFENLLAFSLFLFYFLLLLEKTVCSGVIHEEETSCEVRFERYGYYWY